ncbi:mitochondrial sodium/calcium exchanger protein-like [Sycon ciliatum]|uniref:mitochondrial sodium/calcium exchanger protein-like n=1 Tax=Sycon ciliatum TaxID=27933 RepID=UPI0031F6F7F8
MNGISPTRCFLFAGAFLLAVAQFISLAEASGYVPGQNRAHAPLAYSSPLNVGEGDTNKSSNSCSSVRHLPKDKQCDFIKGTSSCEIDGGYINYLHLPYCLLAGYEPVGLIIIALWMFYIFFSLSVVVDLILCPSLKVITTALHMDENVAGVTFLAFANGAADIFSLLLLVLRGDDDDEDDITGVAGMGSILGGGMFDICIPAGLIALNYPFDSIEKWPFIRNVVFYLAAVGWLTGMLADEVIHLSEAIGFIGLYFGYVFVVWIGHRYTRWKEDKTAEPDTGEPTEKTPLTTGSTRQTYQSNAGNGGAATAPHSEQHSVALPGVAPVSGVGRGLQGRTRDALMVPSAESIDLSLSMASTSESTAHASNSGIDSLENSTLESFPDVEQPPPEPALDETDSEPSHLVGLRKLRDAFVPEEFRNWKETKWHNRLFAVLGYPIRLALLLTCPTIDNEKESCDWNKYQAMITMAVFPSFVALAFDGFFTEISNEVILGPFMAALGLIFCLAVFLFTSVKDVPYAKVLFAAISFLVAITWIYIMADEVVNIVVTFAVSLNATGAILGLIMIATGNSVCDMIANFFVARGGKPLMGFAACIGSPLLNMLIGIGIASTVAIVKEGKPYKLQFPLLLQVASGFLCFSLLLSLALVMARHWSAGKMLGIVMLALYFVFFTVCLALELS